MKEYLLIAVVLFVGIVLFVYARWKWTSIKKEQFNIAALSWVGGSATLVLTSILGQTTPWDALLSILYDFVGKTHVSPPLNTIDVVASCFMVVFLGWFALRLYKKPSKANDQVISSLVKGDIILLSNQELKRIKWQIVKALLDCPSMKTLDMRETVLKDIPDYIFNAISHNSMGKAHVFNIVNTCCNYQDGFASLLDSLRQYDGETDELQVLEGLVSTSTTQPISGGLQL